MADYKRKMGIEEDRDSLMSSRERRNRDTYTPSKYDSIRPAGEEQRLSKRKSEGLKQAAMGVALSPFVVPAETVFGGRPSKDRGTIGAGAKQFAGTGDRLVASLKDAKDFIGEGASQYKNANLEKADLDSELDSQTKREARGKAKGGMVGKASKRADGIAQRGKTKGRMC